METSLLRNLSVTMTTGAGRNTDKSSMTNEERFRLPDDKTLNDLYALQVLDQDKDKVPFKSLISPVDGAKGRNVIIFVRHFFCGHCQDYIRAMVNEPSLSPDNLSKLNPPTTLSIIGCGDPALIPDYIKQTGCPYKMYADPSRATYDKLGFVVTLAMGEEKPKYIPRSTFATVLDSLRITLASGTKALSGGKFNQNGGEMIWVDGELQYCRKMSNTTDHLEVEDLVMELTE